MEQRKSTFTSFIKPFINKLQVSQEEYEERDVFFKPTVMPLIDVVEQIHHSFYFKKPIVLHFEKYDNAGNLVTFTKERYNQEPYPNEYHFVFLEQGSNITHILNVEQIVACMELD